MTKRFKLTIVTSVVAMLAIGYLVGWHTRLGCIVRGVSTIAVVNHSAKPFQYVSVYLTDSQGRQIDRRYEHLEPNRTLRINIRTSDLIVRRIVCEQGQRAFTYDESASVTPGEVFLVAVDSLGRVTGGYEH